MATLNTTERPASVKAITFVAHEMPLRQTISLTASANSWARAARCCPAQLQTPEHRPPR